MKKSAAAIIATSLLLGCGEASPYAPKSKATVNTDPDLVIRYTPDGMFDLNAHGQMVIGEQRGVFMVDDPNQGRLFLNADGSLAGPGTWRPGPEHGDYEFQFDNGRKHGVERHISSDASFTRITHYQYGEKHGEEIIVWKQTNGDISHWTINQFANGNGTGKHQLKHPAADGKPPIVDGLFEEVIKIHTTNN